MTHHRQFKDTQLFDWDTEPRLERSSSFFPADAVTGTDVRRSRRRGLQRRPRHPARRIAWLFAAAATGAAALLQIGPLLRHFAH